jgi:hypothetical protein
VADRDRIADLQDQTAIVSQAPNLSIRPVYSRMALASSSGASIAAARRREFEIGLAGFRRPGLS